MVTALVINPGVSLELTAHPDWTKELGDQINIWESFFVWRQLCQSQPTGLGVIARTSTPLDTIEWGEGAGKQRGRRLNRIAFLLRGE